MKNFGLIYHYEIKKIAKGKLFKILFALILVLTLMINLYTIIDYSVGKNGADQTVKNKYGLEETDYSALFKGIDIRYVDDFGEIVEEKVDPLKYIRMQRSFAMKWSGKPLDDAAITSMKQFFEKYDYVDETRTSYGHSFQNINWIFRMIARMGLNPTAERTNAQTIKEWMDGQWLSLYEDEQLSAEEIAFWNEHEAVTHPLTISYMPAYRQIISYSQWIHVLLLFFIIVVLCDTCCADRIRKTRRLVQTTDKGAGKLIVARLCAGVTVAIVTGIVLYAVTIGIQFAILGADGFDSPVQLIDGLVWSRLHLSSGEAMLLMCATSILLTVMMAAVTMLFSELFQSPVAALAVPSVFLICTLLFNKSFFNEDRVAAQLWQYFPLQRVRVEMLFDERLIPFGKGYARAIPFSIGVYLCVAVIALLLCGGISYFRRFDKK